MGIFSKLMFWKHDDDMPDLGKMPDLGDAPDLGMPGGDGLGMDMPKADDMGMPELGKGFDASKGPQMPPFEEVQQETLHPGYKPPQPAPMPVQPTGEISGKDIEIISLKLDSLKTTLEAINERLARLEKMAQGGGESHRF